MAPDSTDEKLVGFYDSINNLMFIMFCNSCLCILGKEHVAMLHSRRCTCRRGIYRGLGRKHSLSPASRDVSPHEKEKTRPQFSELKKVQAELEKEREARKNMEARFAQWEQEREQQRAERERERAANAIWQKKMEEMMNSSRKK